MKTVEMGQNWLQLAAVQVGGAICLPVFIIGHTLAKSCGVFSAFVAIAVGNFILLLLGCAAAWASASQRKSTAEYAADLFGAGGKGFFSGAMALSLVGWFAIQLNIMSLSLQDLVGVEIGMSGNLILGILITLAGMKGLKGLTIFANISMPLLLLTIAYALYNASRFPSVLEESPQFTLAGASLVLAASIAAVVDLPTFFRAAKTAKDGIFAACVLFGVVIPLIEAVGVYLYMHSRGDNIIEVLANRNSPLMWKLWILLFLLMAGWTTNNANLYSATVSMETMMPQASGKARTLLAGGAGVALSCLHVLDNMVAFLDIIGIVLGSMGAVMIAHFIAKTPNGRMMNFSAWALGVVSGFLSLQGHGLTTIPVLDAFLISMIVMGGMFIKKPIYFRRMKNEENFDC